MHPTPLRAAQDRADFGSWNRLDGFPILSVRRSSAAGRSILVRQTIDD